MTTHTYTSGKGSWFESLKQAFSGLFSRREPERPRDPSPADPARTTSPEDLVDMNSEDSFPASDPPSYTGSSV